MFIATIINFLLFSYNLGGQVARFIVFIRKALALDIDHPLSEQRELDALRGLDVIFSWAPDLPVSVAVGSRTYSIFMLCGDVS